MYVIFFAHCNNNLILCIRVVWCSAWLGYARANASCIPTTPLYILCTKRRVCANALQYQKYSLRFKDRALFAIRGTHHIIKYIV